MTDDIFKRSSIPPTQTLAEMSEIASLKADIDALKKEVASLKDQMAKVIDKAKQYKITLDARC